MVQGEIPDMITLSDLKLRLWRLLQEREDMCLQDIAEAAGVSLSTSTARRWCNPADGADPGFHAVTKVTDRYKLSLDRLGAKNPLVLTPGQVRRCVAPAQL